MFPCSFYVNIIPSCEQVLMVVYAGLVLYCCDPYCTRCNIPLVRKAHYSIPKPAAASSTAKQAHTIHLRISIPQVQLGKKHCVKGT